MEIQATQTAQTYQTGNKTEISSNVEEVFQSMIKEDGSLSISLGEEELKKLSYEEAKELRIKLEKEGYLKENTGDPRLQISSIGNTLLTVTDFTSDDDFNKALFDTMKTKEYPGLYFDEVKHNMEYAQGRRAHPHPSISVAESRGDYSPLTSSEIKNMDMGQFLQDIIQIYEELVLNLPGYMDKEETQKSLDSYKQLQKDYQKNKDEQNAILESYTKNTKPNPLLV